MAKELDAFEQNALVDAGNEAGALLDSWNNTDLALLAEVQWIEFIKTVVTAFGESIRRQAETNAPPF